MLGGRAVALLCRFVFRRRQTPVLPRRSVLPRRVLLAQSMNTPLLRACKGVARLLRTGCTAPVIRRTSCPTAVPSSSGSGLGALGLCEEEALRAAASAPGGTKQADGSVDLSERTRFSNTHSWWVTRSVGVWIQTNRVEERKKTKTKTGGNCDDMAAIIAVRAGKHRCCGVCAAAF